MGGSLVEYRLIYRIGQAEIILREVVVDKLRHRQIDALSVGCLHILIYYISPVLQYQLYEQGFDGIVL